MEVVGQKIKMLGQKMSFRTKNWNLGQNLNKQMGQKINFLAEKWNIWDGKWS